MNTEETYTGRAVNAVSDAVTAGEDLSIYGQPDPGLRPDG